MFNLCLFFIINYLFAFYLQCTLKISLKGMFWLLINVRIYTLQCTDSMVGGGCMGGGGVGPALLVGPFEDPPAYIWSIVGIHLSLLATYRLIVLYSKWSGFYIYVYTDCIYCIVYSIVIYSGPFLINRFIREMAAAWRGK